MWSEIDEGRSIGEGEREREYEEINGSMNKGNEGKKNEILHHVN